MARVTGGQDMTSHADVGVKAVNAEANGAPAAPSSLSEQVGDGRAFEHELLHALQAIRSGDFSVRMLGEQTGVRGKITDLFNDIAAAHQRMAQQLEDVGQSVGREGRTRQRVRLDVSSGAWGEMENRSEERRVGKEGRYRCGPEGAKKRG